MATDPMFVVRLSGTEDLAQDPTEVKKALESIDIRLTNRPISLLQHKIYNVWVAFAQSMTDPMEMRIFEFPLSEVMELCGFDSNNHAYFIEAAKELLDLRVEYDSLARFPANAARANPAIEQGGAAKKRSGRAPRAPVRWAAAQLVSFIEIDSAANTMRIEFPEVLRKEILRPDFYRSIDLRKQQLFTSRAGLALFEHVQRYAAEQKTPWLPWEVYSMLLSGSSEPHKTFREFSKMLQRAVEQVNTHHDSHQVHIEFTKRGRAIEKMRVMIGLKHQARLPLDTQAPPSPALIRAMTALGVRKEEAEQIAHAHPAEYLDAQIAYVRRRLADNQRAGIKVPAAYLRAAISGNYANQIARTGEPNAEPLEDSVTQAIPIALPIKRMPDNSPAINALAAPPTTDPLAETKRWYAELPDDRRSALASQFLAVANPIVRKAISAKGMTSPVAAAAFYGWLRQAQEQGGA